MSLHGNIKFVAENLIFENQDDLVGKTIKINRKSLIINNRIQSKVRQYCSYDMTLKPTKRRLAIKRYGYLDLEFELTNIQRQKCDNPFQILRNEKVLAKNEIHGDEFREDAIDMMNFMLEEDIKKTNDGKLYLKVFAKSIGNFKSRQWYTDNHEIKFNTKPKYPKNPAIVEFRIIDACITNLSGIWFNKYFYW